MSTNLTQKLNRKLFDTFNQSTLGLYCGSSAEALFHQGTVTALPEDVALEATHGRYLIVVLAGCITIGKEWFGPGNHVELDQTAAFAFKGQAELWVLDLTGNTWVAPENIALRRATTHALIAADAAEAAATPPATLPDPATLCDVDHPDIRRRAARLRRTTPAATAEAILQYVHSLPYRFGTWQERASDTMVRGVGMCTTKSNLQVALMRAAGLTAGYVEIPMPTSVLGKLMPDSWIALQRETVKHYFAAVELEGRWHAVDSSYDRVSYRIFLETYPWMAHRETPVLKVGEPYCPALEIQEGADLFDLTVRADIAEEMGKTSRFLPRHFEALNTCVDRARGTQKTWREAMEGAASSSDEALA